MDEEELLKKREELLPKDVPRKEIIANLEIIKDPKYLYFVDKDGNVAKRKKSKRGKNKKPKIFKEKFSNVNIGFPKVLLNSYINYGFKKIGRASKTSGYIWFPKELIGKEFKVILIPKTEWMLAQNE